MGWTTPRTYVDGEIVGAATLNTDHRDNLNHLRTGRARGYNRLAVGNYTTTSAALADVDGTNLAFTFTPISTLVKITVFCALDTTASPGTAAIALNIDGTDTTMYSKSIGVGQGPFWISFVYLATLTLASHTIKLRWSTSAGTLTMYGAGSYPVSMIVEEIA